MGVILAEVNGVMCSSEANGYLLCDHHCQGCVADGRCAAQNDNNEAMRLDYIEWVNSDEHHDEVVAQRNAWFASDAYPSGPEHCWGCCDQGNCSRESMLACLNGEREECDNDCPF
jgi:hypothetical protein